jgi:hypothetical protein
MRTGLRLESLLQLWRSYAGDVLEGVLRNGNDLTVSDVTSSRQGYSVRRKNLDAELGWGFGEDLAGSSAGRPMILECDCFVGHGGGGSAEPLLRSPALGANQIP